MAETWPALDVQFTPETAGVSRPDASLPDLLQAALLDYGVAAIDDNAADTWRVFFHEAGERDRARRGLAADFPALALSTVEVADEDWAARSQADLRAVHVGGIVVAPPWDVPEGVRTVVIQPSMGFGTGHHATTRLCLAALQRAPLRGRSVIDVGTGSGVLAIAASLLGASPVLAIDDDPDAIASARENVGMNRAAHVETRRVDLRTAALPAFDVVLANLTGGLLIQAAGRLQDLATRSGCLILSGFMKHEEAGVLEAFAACAVTDRAEEDEWLCATLHNS